MMRYIKDVSKLYRFGQLLILLNILYCSITMFYFALSRGDYIFTSEYFFATALLILLYCKIDAHLNHRKNNS